jgi:hypothetical protein
MTKKVRVKLPRIKAVSSLIVMAGALSIDVN